MSLFFGTIATLEAALSYSALKQKVIAQNIANADTPNYKAKDVRFQTAVSKFRKYDHRSETDGLPPFAFFKPAACSGNRDDQKTPFIPP